MDPFQAGHLQMFMSVTGASEVVALQKLQAHGGDLNAAINSFFNEGEHPVSQMQIENTNTTDFMEEDAPLPRQNAFAPFAPFYPVPSAPASGARLHPSGFGVEDMSGPPFSTRSSAPNVLQPRDTREISVDWRDEEQRMRPNTRPLLEEIPAVEALQFPSQTHGHITIDDEDVPSTASSMLKEGGTAAGRALFGSNIETSSRHTSLDAPLTDEVPAMVNNEGKDIEEEMLRAAIEASRKEAEASSRRTGQDYLEELSGAGAHEVGMHMEDADLARAVSLSLKTAEEEKALRESGRYLGISEEGFVQDESANERPYGGNFRDSLQRWGTNSTTDNSRTDTETLLNSLPANDFNLQKSTDLVNAAPSSPVEDVDELEEQPLLRRRSGRQLGSSSTPTVVGTSVLHQESPGTRQESSNAATVPADGFHHSAPSQGNDNVFNNDEWGGISSEEHDEAVMLEAAMFGSLPEDAALRFRYPSISGLVGDSAGPPIDDTHDFSRLIPQPPSPTVIAQRRLREEQDDEYLASLEADREKEIKAQIEAEARRLKEAEAQAAAYAEEKLREEEKLSKQRAEEEFRRQAAAKRAALPEEPSVDDEAAVTLLVRMPDGSRQGRRFRKSEILQCLFDFIDVSGGVLPGSYRLVRHYPRQAFTDAEHGQSFNDLGLTSKHEVLFLELI